MEGAGTKSMSGNLDVNGNLGIVSGTLDVTASNFSINLAGNWLDVGGTFNPRAGTVLYDGLTNQFILGNETFYDLTLSNTNGLYLDTDVTVSNNLSMSGGNIITQGHILTTGVSAGNPGNIIYSSGIVIGKLERWIASTATPYLFPIGVSGGYRPANLTFSALSAGSVLSEFVASDPGSAGLPLSEGTVNVTDQYTEGYWSLTANNGLTSADYNLQLTATNFSSYTIIPGYKDHQPAVRWQLGA